MATSSNSELSLSGRALWRASLGLLLLCGLVGWTGATVPMGAHGADQSILHSQERQLEWAESFENLWARPSLRKEGALTEPVADAGADGAEQSVVCLLTVCDYYRVTGGAAAPQSPLYPLQGLYLLPAPRGPPAKA